MKGIAIVSVAGFLMIAGMLAGQLFPGEARAQGTEVGFSECAAVTMYANAGKSINAGHPPQRSIKVPAGWTPVGGGSRGGEPVVVYCR